MNDKPEATRCVFASEATKHRRPFVRNIPIWSAILTRQSHARAVVYTQAFASPALSTGGNANQIGSSTMISLSQRTGGFMSSSILNSEASFSTFFRAGKCSLRLRFISESITRAGWSLKSGSRILPYQYGKSLEIQRWTGADCALSRLGP